jgi:hypothetical protein
LLEYPGELVQSVIDVRRLIRYDIESGELRCHQNLPARPRASLVAEGSIMFRICVSLVILIGVSGPVVAVSPDPKTLAVPPTELSKSRQLVQQLGSEQFDEREEAEQALGKMGRSARLALLEGVNADPNPEIRNRCAALLPKANALEMKARLEVFLADVEGKYEHDLPGWNQFRATVCNDWIFFGCRISSDSSLEKAARSVFVELISTPANKSVVMGAGGSQAERSSIVIARRQELYSQKYGRPIGAGGFTASTIGRRDPTAEDIAALLFAESLAPQTTARVPRQASISLLITSSGFSSQARDTDEKGRVYKAIAAAWLESRINPTDLYQGMTIATNLGLTNLSLRMAGRLFTTPGGTVNNRGNAAMTLVRLGGKEHIPLLEKAFEDTGVLTLARVGIRGNIADEVPNHEIQVRDVALAVSIQLAGQTLEDYGFIDQFKANGGPDGFGYSYTRYYLPDDKRTAAFEKWKDWWAKNKDK